MTSLSNLFGQKEFHRSKICILELSSQVLFQIGQANMFARASTAMVWNQGTCILLCTRQGSPKKLRRPLPFSRQAQLEGRSAFRCNRPRFPFLAVNTRSTPWWVAVKAAEEDGIVTRVLSIRARTSLSLSHTHASSQAAVWPCNKNCSLKSAGEKRTVAFLAPREVQQEDHSQLQALEQLQNHSRCSRCRRRSRCRCSNRRCSSRRCSSRCISRGAAAANSYNMYSFNSFNNFNSYNSYKVQIAVIGLDRLDGTRSARHSWRKALREFC